MFSFLLSEFQSLGGQLLGHTGALCNLLSCTIPPSRVEYAAI
jgi:hypothetical protein